jgi:hypothetical protein
VSITFLSKASLAVRETLLRTIDAATPAFLPRSSARDRICAARSLVIFRFSSLSCTSCPEALTGWAAPMFVPGAMAAIWAAITRNAPADAARAPVGPTQTATGIGAERIFWDIPRIEVTRPPGVSRPITTRAALSFRA